MTALLLTAHAGPEPVLAQAVEPRTPVERMELGGRVHTQFSTTSADSGAASEFRLRRARLWTAVRVNDLVDGAAQVDFFDGGVAARFAFLRLSLAPSARVAFGQFKRAFDLFELTSSSQILVVERDGQIRGVGACSGVGGMCTYSRFSEELQLSSLDIGLLLEGELAAGRLAYLVSITNGAGGNTREENDAKSFAGRLEWLAGQRLRLAANLGVHDFPNERTARDAYAPAVALDAEWGDFEDGLHVQGGVLGGENWRNLDAEGEGSRFLTWQIVVAHRFSRSAAARVAAVEPLVRVSWGDPDRSATRDGGVLFTPGVALHLVGRNKLAANLDVWRPQTGPTEWGLKVQTYLYF